VSEPNSKSGLIAFFLTLTALAILRIAMSYLLVPEALKLPLSILVTVVFVAAPVLALFSAGRHSWTPKRAVFFVISGALLQFGLPLAFGSAQGFAALTLDAVSQQGLPMWTVGLGALLATLLKDKNLLLPVSIFLALFDIFLVFTPVGFVQVLMKKAPNLLPAMAHHIPQVVTQKAEVGARIGTFAVIGPADFVFMAMFFIALYRFHMRTGTTFRWLLVALAVYLPLAFILGPVPLLVPIGLSVLLVNLPEFKMTSEEKVSTIAVAVLGVAIVVYAATRPRPVEPAVPLPRESVQGAPKSAD
jgi:hypothetical protein